MCGGAAPNVLAQVERIVESGADLAYLKELEATERDLKARQKALALPWALCAVRTGSAGKRPAERLCH